MKLIFTPFIFLFAVFCGSAQTPAVSEGHGLSVVRQKWHRELRRSSALERDPVEETDRRQTAEQRRREIERQNEILRTQGMPQRDLPIPELPSESRQREPSASYVYEVSLRNDSKREVSSITWEYVFLDPATKAEVGRRRFTSKTRIGSGKSRTITMRSAIPPTGAIDATKASARSQEKYSEEIVLVSVEYSDGTKWPTVSN